MTRSGPPTPGPDPPSNSDAASSPEQRARPLGAELSHAFGRLFDAIPGAPQAPTALARKLGVSRVTISKLLNAIASPDPFQVLQGVPGPESLRVLTQAAAQLQLPGPLVADAARVTEEFARFIRQDFGTRGALNAAISSKRPEMQRRFELASRYQVYKGLREILGVAADMWLNCMLFAPSTADDESLSVTSIHGALAMRRLRPDVNVYFTTGSPPPIPASTPPGALPPQFAVGAVSLADLYTHAPATLESRMVGTQMVHRLADDRLGRHALADMLAITHNQRGSRRYAAPDRPRGGAVLFPDIPVKQMVFDVLLHDDVFPGAVPELIVFNTGVRGPANPADPARQIDRIAVPESIEALGKHDDRFILEDVPNYDAIVRRVCTAMHTPINTFRLFRLRMAYPVHGFQFVMAFDAPPKPS